MIKPTLVKVEKNINKKLSDIKEEYNIKNKSKVIEFLIKSYEKISGGKR